MKDINLHLKKLFYYPYEPTAYLTIHDGMRAVVINSNWFNYFHIIGTGFQKFNWKKSPGIYEYGNGVCKSLQAVSSINCNKAVNKIIMLMSNKIVNELSSNTENGSYRVFFGKDLEIVGNYSSTNTHVMSYIQSYFEEYKKSLDEDEPVNAGYNKIMNNVDLYYVYHKIRNALLENNGGVCLDNKKIISISFNTIVSLSSELTCIAIKAHGEHLPISFYSVEELRGKITCQKVTTTQMEF